MTKRAHINYSILLLLLLPFFSVCKTSPTPRDVIKVMTYNVLKYGDGCQGTGSQMHGYLKTIVKYTDPDILGLVKVEAIPSALSDKGKAPKGFEDSILLNALNAAHPDKYACCPFSNAARDNNQTLLYYNKHKFGFSSFVTLVSDVTDINMYKLYYLGYNLPNTKDTSFLYIVLVHTNSGDDPDERDRQMTEVMSAMRKRFPALPNVIVMGDFNLRKTNEQGYKVLTNNAEKSYCFIDPPFAIDKTVEYPANWERFAGYLTTSTRKQDKEPNNCGTGGAAKGWYDHILLAPPLGNKSNHYYYISHSYRTIGNDGHRVDASVNDLPNKSAPAEVLDALYQMSNKYPVMLELGINP